MWQTDRRETKYENKFRNKIKNKQRRRGTRRFHFLFEIKQPYFACGAHHYRWMATTIHAMQMCYEWTNNI